MPYYQAEFTADGKVKNRSELVDDQGRWRGPVGTSGDRETVYGSTVDVGSELGLPSYDDVANAPATAGRAVWVTGNGATTPAGVYRYDGSSYSLVAVAGVAGQTIEPGQVGTSSNPVSKTVTEDITLTTVSSIDKATSQDQRIKIAKKTAINGSKVWEFADPSGNVFSSPTVVDGTVYVGSDDSSLYAVDAADGSKVWEFTDPSDHVRSSPTVVDGTVYVGSNDNSLYAVDAVERFARLYVADGEGWIPLHKGPNEASKVASATISGSHSDDKEQTLGFVRDNNGTEADAIDTNTASVQSVTVTHGLDVAPEPPDIRAVPTNGPNNGESMHVSQIRNINSTDFTVDVEVTSTSGGSGETADLSWDAEVQQ